LNLEVNYFHKPKALRRP